VSDLDVQVDPYMVSFDVESLFTNVPTQETIELILKLAFPNDEENVLFHGLTRTALRRLLVICTQESHFQFNGKYYDQIDGVAMGSPLGPLFANVFMSEFERGCITRLRELGVIKWYRYVDDVFATVTDSNAVDDVLRFLNSQHPNIRFTCEHENKNQLPFLDTCVVRLANRYKTKVYRKKTFTGVYLNWNSLTANRYKIGLIRCLAERAWRICSDEKDRYEELEKLKVILHRNDYPPDIVENTISKMIAKKRNPPVEQELEMNEKPEKVFFKLPYVGRKCEDFAYRMKRTIENTFDKVEFNVAFQAPMTMEKMFPFKDKSKVNLEKSSVVYRLVCSCGKDYIGMTQHILSIRMQQHSSRKDSACFQHTRNQAGKHMIDYNNPEVLDSADTAQKLAYKELLHILEMDPELNKQLGKQSKYETKTLIIKAYPQFRDI
jgi:hypothetical protein